MSRAMESKNQFASPMVKYHENGLYHIVICSLARWLAGSLARWLAGSA